MPLRPLLLAVFLLPLPAMAAADGVLRLPSTREGAAMKVAAPCDLAPSAARAWNEQLLVAIRRDAPKPPVHARNLFHVSLAMYDAWAAYDPVARGYLHGEAAAPPAGQSREQAQVAALSHAAYGVLRHRFASGPGGPQSLASFRSCMQALGLDPDDLSTTGPGPAALGNRVAATVIGHGLWDGANEAGGYVDDTGYLPLNAPMQVPLPGSGGVLEVNRWQPLVPPGAAGAQGFLTPFWGRVQTFALERGDPGSPYLDPGPPPLLGGLGDATAKADVLAIIRQDSWREPDDGVLIQLSPGARGNNSLGADDGLGHALNPATGQPYAPNPALRGDWVRVVAEFWADGPQSSTPPGHWNELANAVGDHPQVVHRIGGSGPLLSRLEWDIKLYLALNGAVHDSAIATWEIKRRYDASRPITLIREMGGLGQSSEPGLPAYHPMGLPLEPGLVELVTAESSAPGERHAHLAAHVGRVAILAWGGFPADPASEHGGIAWILPETWIPYQQRGFVTPPFPGYTSGHSSFSRASAEVLAAFTGSPFFPGGLAEYVAEPGGDGFILGFEYGPRAQVRLQWATYFDAADEAGQSRIAGGIHPAYDDYPGRRIGHDVGRSAVDQAFGLFGLLPTPGGAIELQRWSDMPTLDHVGPPAETDYFSSGIAFADFDDDRRQDLVLTSTSAGNVLLANAGQGRLQVSPQSADIALAHTLHSGALALDYDNDGWRDLLILSIDRVYLFRNQAGAGFVDVSVAAGLADIVIRGQSAAAGDIDGDGLLDLYLVGWFDTGHPLATDRLLRQQPDGTFADWSALLDPAVRGRPGFAASMLDLDDDGDLDIYVVNDKQLGNALWRNDGPGCGSWCFSDVATATGAARPVFGMGLAHGDFDHDGDIDLYFSSIGEQVLLRNELQAGSLAFTDVGVASGTAFAGIGWGAEFVDLDNDGRLDLYLCTMNPTPGMGNRVYWNRGDGSFVDRSRGNIASDNGPSIGLAKGDLDDDGRVDLAIGNWKDGYRVFRNETASTGRWLGLRLIGAAGVNRDAVGAKVLVRDSLGRTHRRDVHLGSGMGGSSDSRIHVGLGEAELVDVLVRWPDRTFQFVDATPGSYLDVPYAGIPELIFADDFE